MTVARGGNELNQQIPILRGINFFNTLQNPRSCTPGLKPNRAFFLSCRVNDAAEYTGQVIRVSTGGHQGHRRRRRLHFNATDWTPPEGRHEAN